MHFYISVSPSGGVTSYKNDPKAFILVFSSCELESVYSWLTINTCVFLG